MVPDKINDHKKLMQTSSLISFVGNWRGSSRYVKGHTRRLLKSYYNQLSTSKNDSLIVVEEYGSTITCNSCFQQTRKQLVRRDNKIKRIQDAVVCINPICALYVKHAIPLPRIVIKMVRATLYSLLSVPWSLGTIYLCHRFEEIIQPSKAFIEIIFTYNTNTSSLKVHLVKQNSRTPVW